MHYIKVYIKGGVIKGLCLCRNLMHEFILSIMFKVIDSLDRISSEILTRYLTFACCLISVPLYTIFRDLAFQSLCLVSNNIDFVLS